MHIGVNLLYLIPGGVGGTEIYARQLIAAMARAAPHHRFTLITNSETAPASFGPVHVLQQPVAARIRPARILWEQTALPALALRRRFDVLFNPGFTAPLVCPCPQVTVFHDLQHKRHPEFFRWFDLPFWNLLLYGSARGSKELIAVSEATRQDLLRYYARESTVVWHGVEPELFEVANRRAPERIILCVSTLHPHKGIECLLQAFAAVRTAHPGFRLVLAGMRGFAAESVDRTISALGLAQDVELTGWLERDRLRDLYRRAWMFVYPSRFEGFGMPVAEAMAAGVPVACSDIEPLRSVAGGAAELFPPGDHSAIASALARLAADERLRLSLSEKGRARAARFTWESAARETLAVLERAASPSRIRR